MFKFQVVHIETKRIISRHKTKASAEREKKFLNRIYGPDNLLIERIEEV